MEPLGDQLESDYAPLPDPQNFTDPYRYVQFWRLLKISKILNFQTNQNFFLNSLLISHFLDVVQTLRDRRVPIGIVVFFDVKFRVSVLRIPTVRRDFAKCPEHPKTARTYRDFFLKKCKKHQRFSRIPITRCDFRARDLALKTG